jgi:hypothetical protein
MMHVALTCKAARYDLYIRSRLGLILPCLIEGRTLQIAEDHQKTWSKPIKASAYFIKAAIV